MTPWQKQYLGIRVGDWTQLSPPIDERLGAFGLQGVED